MGLKHKEPVPASFGDAFAPNYLGSPEVVGRLLAQFCADVEQMFSALAQGSVTKDEFTVQTRSLVWAYADIFAGRNPQYSYPKGFNDHSLGPSLITPLASFWAKNRSKWDDDPVAVFF